MTPLSAPDFWGFILTEGSTLKVIPAAMPRSQTWFEAREKACLMLGRKLKRTVDPGQVECVKRPGVRR